MRFRKLWFVGRMQVGYIDVTKSSVDPIVSEFMDAVSLCCTHKTGLIWGEISPWIHSSGTSPVAGENGD